MNGAGAYQRRTAANLRGQGRQCAGRMRAGTSKQLWRWPVSKPSIRCNGSPPPLHSTSSSIRALRMRRCDNRDCSAGEWCRAKMWNGRGRRGIDAPHGCSNHGQIACSERAERQQLLTRRTTTRRAKAVKHQTALLKRQANRPGRAREMMLPHRDVQVRIRQQQAVPEIVVPRHIEQRVEVFAKSVQLRPSGRAKNRVRSACDRAPAPRFRH